MTRVADLAGAELALWVARAEGLEDACLSDDGLECLYVKHEETGDDGWWTDFEPAEDWATGGPIIEREHLVVWPYRLLDQDDLASGVKQDYAAKRVGMVDPEATGPTYLIAAMRAYVASKFGDKVTDLS
jgi:Protein of unknown function (DUF2591)